MMLGEVQHRQVTWATNEAVGQNGVWLYGAENGVSGIDFERGPVGPETSGK